MILHEIPAKTTAMLAAADPEKGGGQLFFELGIKYLNLIRKYPATGRATSVDIELQTARNLGFILRYPLSSITCPDVFVVARGVISGQIIGANYINTSFGFFMNDCIGKGTLNLNWATNDTGMVVFEVYEKSTNFNNIADRIPVYTSQQFDLGMSAKESREAGYIREESADPLSASLIQITEPIRQATKLVALGGALYYSWQYRHVIKKGIDNLIGKSKAAKK